MESMNNNSNQNNELKELIESAKSMQGSVKMCQITNQFAIDTQGTIRVPRGFARLDGTAVTWQVSIDRHQLKAVSYEVAVPGTAFVNSGTELIDTMVKLYQVRIVGVLYYNIVLGSFRPVTSGYSDGRAVFTVSGEIPVNFVAGYVSDPCEIRDDILNNLIFDVIIQNPTIVVNGEVITFNPANPELFYSAFNGLNDVQFTVPFTVIISSTPIIS